MTGRVFHVPAEGLEKGIDEFPAQLRFVVMAGPVSFAVAIEALSQIQDFFWSGHFQNLTGAHALMVASTGIVLFNQDVFGKSDQAC
jgi:hypothetical protein